MFTNIKKSFFVLLATTVASISQASLIEVAPNTQASTHINGVAIYPAVNTNVDGANQTLTLLGAGLRSKKVAIVWAKVYVAQAFAQMPDAFVREDAKALASIEAVGTVAMQLKFLRTVDAGTVTNSFRDAFYANSVDVNKKEIAAFLEAVAAGGDALDGSTLTVRGRKLADGMEEIAYEDSRGAVKTLIGPAGFLKEVFGLWYGNPVDAGLANLKAALIAKPWF